MCDGEGEEEGVCEWDVKLIKTTKLCKSEVSIEVL